MEDFFSEQTYYEFPSIESAIFALLLSFLLSTIIAFVYRYTYSGRNYSRDLFQAIILISIVAATIMMAIGDSLARGLGILGALAIIRFRFRFANPRNIIYIFASLALGISCGVYGFAIALSGTLIFSLVAFGLHLSPYGKPDIYDLNISFNIDSADKIDIIETLLWKYCEAVRLVNISERNESEKYEYRLLLKNGIDQKSLFRELSSLDFISNLSMNNRGSIDRI